jgi:hypothetical protein
MKKFLPATLIVIALAAFLAGPAAAQEEATDSTAATAETPRKELKIVTAPGDEAPCGDEDMEPLDPDSEVRKMKVMIPIFGMTIPIIFILGAAAVVVVAVLLAHRTAMKRFEVIQVAIKEGRELPPDIFRNGRRHRRRDPLLAGLVLTGLGVAVSISVGAVCGAVQAVWGLIPLLIGLALLAYGPLYRKLKKEDDD